MAWRRKRPGKIVGVYDSETCNVVDGDGARAYPVLHQLGILECDSIRDVTPGNVEELLSVELYRHTDEACVGIEALIDYEAPHVPVLCIHNLSFDMYPLSAWLSSHDVRVLAKSSVKPISFQIQNDKGETGLVIWDTLGFSMQGLARMGEDCGYGKAVGDWDYSRTRTPATPLTDEEVRYATHDLYALAAWLGWKMRQMPWLDEGELGLSVVTKTGIVRAKRKWQFDQVRGEGLKQNAGRMYHFVCRSESAKSDDELFTMHAATRGGLTFTAERHASVAYDLGDSACVAGYDATSQHPAQMLSHFYPIRFREVSPRVLDLALDVVLKTRFEQVLRRWECPFGCAFHAAFEIRGLRLKSGSVFEREGIGTLASARVGSGSWFVADDDDAGNIFRERLAEMGYKDRAEGARVAFGKVTSADVMVVYLTELEAWICGRVYEWDSIRAIGGYYTANFQRPCDYDVLSVMGFYHAKDVFKEAKEAFEHAEPVDGVALSSIVPASIAKSMEDGIADDRDVAAQYQLLKSDLNSLFGIAATNEARDDFELTGAGMVYKGASGIVNLPKNPKAWYQFGQRIVGWSRVAQVVVLELVGKASRGILNGDTDSVKILVDRSSLEGVDAALSRLGNAIDSARSKVCKRVRERYPELFHDTPGIGHYVREFEASRYCAAWNKCYCIQSLDKRDGKQHFKFTLAGVTTNHKVPGQSDHSFNALADYLSHRLGWTFREVCDLLLGYDLFIDSSVTGQNGRKVPAWGDAYVGTVTDWRGERVRVTEPRALALYPLTKVPSSLTVAENRINREIALSHGATPGSIPVVVEWSGDAPHGYLIDTGEEIF